MSTSNRRRLPNWLAQTETSNDKSLSISASPVSSTDKKKNKKCSNIIEQKTVKETNTNIKNPTTVTMQQKYNSERILRSNSRNSSDTSENKEKKLPSHQYPFIEYKGDIKFFSDSIDIACASDEIMSWVELQNKTIVPIAFDMEWSFSFATGPGKTALIQLCADENVCFLFHIYNLKKLPVALIALLDHKKVQLHGVNIKNDLRKLKRDFPEINVDNMIKQCLDLGTWCNDVCDTGGRWSLERLVLYICRLRINKDKKVRMSKWNMLPLSDNQKLYAAIDVYISQVIHKELENRKLTKEKCTQEFLNAFGEEALLVAKALEETFL